MAADSREILMHNKLLTFFAYLSVSVLVVGTLLTKNGILGLYIKHIMDMF